MPGTARNGPGALIAGGGIAGLTASLALRNAGFVTRVFEAAPDFSELGVAVILGPNGMKSLRALGRGIFDAVVHQGMATRKYSTARLIDPSGSAVGLDAARADGIDLVELFGAPQVTIRRNRLQNILLDAHKGSEVHGSRRLVDFDEDAETVTARFEDGSQETGDLLIGADGINSTVRAILHGAEDSQFTGWASLRGIIPHYTLPSGYETGVQIVDGNAFVIVMPIDGGDCYVSTSWPVEENTWPHDPIVAWEGVIRRIDGWFIAEDALRAVDTSTVVPREVRDRVAIPSWSKGRATLVGDAAHAMSNNWGQGANSAMEDGVVLARCLVELPDLRAALSAYDTLRIPRTARLQKASRDLSTQRGDIGEFLAWLHSYDAATTPLPIGR
jgi:salicylate hydroxylase